MTESIKFTNAALDEAGDEIVLRGVVDPSSLAHLQVDDYQREVLPASQIRNLEQAIQQGGVPDIDLGMRGGSFLEREGNFYLRDQVFIIDGLQRRTAALELLRKGELPHLGAIVHFNSSKEWERERFRKLNVSRVKLSASVLLRNERASNLAVEMLYGLSSDSTFILKNRVCWEQRMRREHLIGALALLKSTCVLHRRLQLGMVSTNYKTGADGLLKMMQRVGRNVVRENVKDFWEVLDECFGVRSVAYVVSAPHLRIGFLCALSNLFGSHQDFWTDARLTVNTDTRRKLAQFQIHDPYVASLCGSSGAGRKILVELLHEHIDSGKRTRRLRPFRPVESEEADEPVAV